MMTTLEFIYFVCDEEDPPCEHGIQFAKENPDLLSAIQKLLDDGIDGQYIRWTVWQRKVLGDKYWDFTDDFAAKLGKISVKNYMNELNQECAKILIKFIKENNL